MGIRKNRGRWTHEEHLAFLRGLHLYDRTWEAIASLVPTRSVLQIRTHSQKYFAKINSGGVFPEEPYPSQYDAAAGKAGAAAGAYLYDVPQEWHEQEQQQQQQQQAKPVGGNAAVMPEFLPLDPPPLSLQQHWGGGGGGGGGNYDMEVKPCLPHSSPLVRRGQQQHAPQAAGFTVPPSVGAFPPGISCDRGDSGSGSGSSSGSPNFGLGFIPSRYDSAGGAPRVWFGRGSGAPNPVKRGLSPSPLNGNHEGKNKNKRSITDVGRPQRNGTAASAASFPASSSSPSSATIFTAPLSSPSSFSSEPPPTTTPPAFGCASGLPATDLADAHPASFGRPDLRQQGIGGGEQSGGGVSSHHQGRVCFCPDLEAGFPRGAGCRAGGAYPRQGGGSFDGSGTSGGHQQHLEQHLQQWDLGVLPVFDDPPVWSISRDRDPFCPEKRQKKQQHGVFEEGASRRPEAPQQESAPYAQQVLAQDLLPFYGWFEGGVGAGGDLGDVAEPQEGGDEDGGIRAGVDFIAQHHEAFSVL